MLNINELRKLFASSKSKSEVGTSLLSGLARKELKDFMEFFRKDYATKIDWSKGYELMDEDLPNYVSERDLKKKDRFFMLVKAFWKNGDPCRFIITTIVDLNRGEIKVGTADLPEADQWEEGEDDEGMDENALMAMFAKNMMEKMKSGQIEKLDDSANCSRCGRSDLPLTITIDVASIKTQKICSVCLHNGGARNEPPKPKTVKELDEEIAEYEKIAKSYEDMIKARPEPEDVPKELASIAMTPLGNYRSIQAVLADLRSKRLQAMTSMADQTRLEYELKKALEAEDYEQSAKLRDRLNALGQGRRMKK